jgi:hypothetical protein
LFRLFGVAQGSKVYYMFRKAWNTIQSSLSNRLSRIWWNASVRRISGKFPGALRCTSDERSIEKLRTTVENLKIDWKVKFWELVIKLTVQRR